MVVENMGTIPCIKYFECALYIVDLGRLIQNERSKQNSQNTSLSSHIPTDTSYTGECI